MRNLQIGVMGSAADLNYAKNLEAIAERVGELVAENNCILFFGAEKDFDWDGIGDLYAVGKDGSIYATNSTRIFAGEETFEARHWEKITEEEYDKAQMGLPLPF